jgi:capsular polysaccharide biosynthesis protein
MRLPHEIFSEVEIFVEGQLTIYRQNKEIIGEYSYGGDFLSVNRCECLINEFKENFEEIHIQDAVSFLSPGAYNIHHFFFEVLPVIYANKEQLRNRKVLVPSTSGGGGFFSEFNELLQLGIEIIEIPIKTLVFGRNLTVYGTFPFRIYPLQEINKIRKQILENLETIPQSAKHSLVYIGRGDTERDRRKITNESEVFKILDQSGLTYSVVRPGLLPLEQTIQQVMHAGTIIGPTGGGIFHQIWAKSLKTIIELKPIRYESMSESEEFASFFDYSYSHVPTLPDSTGFWSQANQEVDLDSFVKSLESL